MFIEPKTFELNYSLTLKKDTYVSDYYVKNNVLYVETTHRNTNEVSVVPYTPPKPMGAYWRIIDTHYTLDDDFNEVFIATIYSSEFGVFE